jgi:ABC-type glutathione transport system ATPase component
MCFDEATSALDTQTEREIQRAIEEVSRGCTTLMIAHRLSTVRNCDLIIVLKHGQIVEQGCHADLINEPDGYYRALWEKQSEQQTREQEEKARKEREEAEFLQALERKAAKKAQKKTRTGINEEDEDEIKESDK